MKKVIFLDVDGTLCGRDGSVPTSARNAINSARENGHRIFLCTGRSKPELIDDILEVSVDGTICAGGGYIQVGDKVLFHQVMNPEDVKEAIEYFNKNGVGYYLESNDGFMTSDNCISKIIELATDGQNETEKQKTICEIQWFIDVLEKKSITDTEYKNVNKIVFINNTVEYKEIEEKFSSKFFPYRATVYMLGNESGELAIKGCNKYTSIKILEEKLNIKNEDTIAFGDSYNDIDMFNAVNYSVAMANAPKELKEIADEITNLAEDDGIYNSFMKNNLI